MRDQCSFRVRAEGPRLPARGRCPHCGGRLTPSDGWLECRSADCSFARNRAANKLIEKLATTVPPAVAEECIALLSDAILEGQQEIIDHPYDYFDVGGAEPVAYYNEGYD